MLKDYVYKNLDAVIAEDKLKSIDKNQALIYFYKCVMIYLRGDKHYEKSKSQLQDYTNV